MSENTRRSTDGVEIDRLTHSEGSGQRARREREATDGDVEDELDGLDVSGPSPDGDDGEIMTGFVSQVLEPDDLDAYAIPTEVVDGLQEGEDLVVVLTSPMHGSIRRILDVPLLGDLLNFVWIMLTLLPRIEPLAEIQGMECVALESGSVDVDSWIVARVEEAVVEETAAREEVLERRVWLYEGEVVDHDGGRA